jgi:TonB family protein
VLNLFLTAAMLIAADPTPAITDNGVEQTKNGAFIFRKYPPRARSAKEQGDVRFRAAYDRKGYVLSCEVIGSSGFRRLDEETCELIVRHARFKPALLNDGRHIDGTRDGIVEWRIPGEPAPSPPLLTSSSDKPEKLICKKIPRSNSMVIMSKQCLTKREWEKQGDEVRETVGEAQRRASQRIQ